MGNLSPNIGLVLPLPAIVEVGDGIDDVGFGKCGVVDPLLGSIRMISMDNLNIKTRYFNSSTYKDI